MVIFLQATGRWPSIAIFYILLLAVFYVLLIRPQMTQQRRRRDMLRKLKRGDRIVTVGGLHATIHDLDDENTLTLELAPNFRVKADKSAIGYVRARKPEQSASPISGAP